MMDLKEADTLLQGMICLGCSGDAETDNEERKAPGPELKAVPAAQAVGKTLLHDMTRIIPGREKGVLFHRGQVLGDAGCRDMLYGSPILPGAMTLVAKIGTTPVLGVPACGLSH